MGAASNMICSIHSSINRCDISTVTSTPSRQETMALQTDTDTKAIPQESTGSKIASTPASLKKTKESQKDVPRESPEVSTTFRSNLPHQNTGTVASFGETSFFEGSSKAKEADNQVDVPVIVGSTVAVVFMVLGLPLLALGYIRCYRSSRSRSGSMQAGSDVERGLVKGTAACVMVNKGTVMCTLCVCESVELLFSMTRITTVTKMLSVQVLSPFILETFHVILHSVSFFLATNMKCLASP